LLCFASSLSLSFFCFSPLFAFSCGRFPLSFSSDFFGVKRAARSKKTRHRDVIRRRSEKKERRARCVRTMSHAGESTKQLVERILRTATERLRANTVTSLCFKGPQKRKKKKKRKKKWPSPLKKKKFIPEPPHPHTGTVNGLEGLALITSALSSNSSLRKLDLSCEQTTTTLTH
jgi:hypothetical protein